MFDFFFFFFTVSMKCYSLASIAAFPENIFLQHKISEIKLAFILYIKMSLSFALIDLCIRITLAQVMPDSTKDHTDLVFLIKLSNHIFFNQEVTCLVFFFHSLTAEQNHLNTWV